MCNLSRSRRTFPSLNLTRDFRKYLHIFEVLKCYCEGNTVLCRIHDDEPQYTGKSGDNCNRRYLHIPIMCVRMLVTVRTVAIFNFMAIY